MAEGRQIEVRDLPAELGPPRALAQRPPDAQQIHAEARQLLPRLVGIDLRHRRLVGEGRAVPDEAPGAVEDEAERRDVGGDRGEAPPQARVVRQRRAADLRCVGIVHQLPQHPLERRGFIEAPPEPVGVEPVQERLEALARGPEHEVGGHAHVVEEHLVVVDLAGQASDGADVHAGRPVRHDEHAEAAAAA